MKTDLRPRIWKRIQYRRLCSQRLKLCPDVDVESKHNQQIESEILSSQRRQENKSPFFVFLVENQTQWPSEEIPMSRVPRQGREGESQSDYDHSGNRPAGSQGSACCTLEGSLWLVQHPRF